jgi:hypothetical protein
LARSPHLPPDELKRRHTLISSRSILQQLSLTRISARAVERLIEADHAAGEELQKLGADGLNSGDPIQAGLDYWEEKHRQLDERLRSTCEN